jgi:glycosyltransferase involved in cell wall biosynthesis
VLIAHVTDRVSERGGADLHLLAIARRQQARGHRVLIVAGRDDGTARSPAEVSLVPGLAKRAVRGDVLERLAALTKGVDVLHVHNAIQPRLLEWAGERKAVATVQDHRSFCPGRGKLTLLGAPCAAPMDGRTCADCFDDDGYYERILDVTEGRARALARMAAVTVLSHYMRHELVSVGVPPERVHVIPPFVDELDIEAEPDGPPCVLFAGRLVEAKGVRDAIAAHERAGVELPLVFAGTGTLRGELEARFEVLGWRPHRRMGAVYRRARALLMPSRWQEPFGIAGIEALACGVPVVAYDSGGIGEWHPGQGLVPWGDVAALATALRDAVKRPLASLAPRRSFVAENLMDDLERAYDRASHR